MAAAIDNDGILSTSDVNTYVFLQPRPLCCCVTCSVARHSQRHERTIKMLHLSGESHRRTCMTFMSIRSTMSPSKEYDCLQDDISQGSSMDDSRLMEPTIPSEDQEAKLARCYWFGNIMLNAIVAESVFRKTGHRTAPTELDVCGVRVDWRRCILC